MKKTAMIHPRISHSTYPGNPRDHWRLEHVEQKVLESGLVALQCFPQHKAGSWRGINDEAIQAVRGCIVCSFAASDAWGELNHLHPFAIFREGMDCEKYGTSLPRPCDV